MKAPLDAKIYLQRLQTVAYLSLGIPLLFFIYLYLESSVDQLEEKIPKEFHNAVLIPILIACISIIVWSFKKHKNLINSALAQTTLREKLAIYQTANTNRFIIYGIVAMFLSFGFYLTNYQPFAATFAIILVLFSINNPGTRKIITDLNLQGKDKEIIFNGLEIP